MSNVVKPRVALRTRMKKTELKRFARDLMRNITMDVLRDIDRVPDDWDGLEIRELIARRAEQARFLQPTGSPRRRECIKWLDQQL